MPSSNTLTAPRDAAGDGLHDRAAEREAAADTCGGEDAGEPQFPHDAVAQGVERVLSDAEVGADRTPHLRHAQVGGADRDRDDDRGGEQEDE
jgi:hypothetical protein